MKKCGWLATISKVGLMLNLSMNYFLILPSLCLAVVSLCSADQVGDLSTRYRFQRVLDNEGRYVLHWSFDLDAGDTGTISFAVNVSTTGWVGFGLSPNGQMPRSDVVIGWVDEQGESQFHVSFSSTIILA